MESLALPPSVITASQWGFGALTAATGWARVEAGRHYPSDVLAGAALGHFIGAFINDAFLGINGTAAVAPLIEPSRDGIFLGLRIAY